MRAQAFRTVLFPTLLGVCSGLGVLLTIGVGLGQPLLAQPNRPGRPDFFEEGQEQFEEEIERLEEQQPQTPLLTVEGQVTTWFPVLLREGGYSVWMPQGATTQSTHQVETPGGAVTFTLLSTTSPIGQFATAFSEPLDDPLLRSPGETLTQVQERISGWQTGFSLVGDRSFRVDDFAAREFTLQNEREVITFRLLLGGDRLYVLAVNQLPEAVSSEAIAAFFNSFQRL
ncbi:MAG: hypothetical protein VKK04_11095 [Synechococcales bacterium]|nr:hypothetical protein [Synechococcales bacterium]